MANALLFRSSAAIAVVHAAALWWFQAGNALLTATIVLGVATSLWNHGVTSSLAKIADRAMMWVGFCIDLHLVWSVPDVAAWATCFATLVASALLYFAAKWGLRLTERRSSSVSGSVARAWPVRVADLPHVLAHLSLTTTHVMLLEAYAESVAL